MTVPYASTGLPFATAGVTALLVGVANGANPAAPIGATVTLGRHLGPDHRQLTSASSFVEATAAPRAAPYDIISIFGTNLCPLCSGSNSVLVGAPDAVYIRYPLFLSPDASAGSPHKITVIFSKPGHPGDQLARLSSVRHQ